MSDLPEVGPGDSEFPLWTIQLSKTFGPKGEDVDWEIVAGNPTLMEVVGAVEWVKMQVQRQMIQWENERREES